jgi:hypothetical protein
MGPPNTMMLIQSRSTKTTPIKREVKGSSKLKHENKTLEVESRSERKMFKEH